MTSDVTPSDVPVLPRHRVLIVDDDRDFVDIQAVLLESLRQVVYRVYDGSSALAAATRFKPDLVLLDIDMPGLHGLDVARELRTLALMKDSRIFAQAGLAHMDYRAALESAGFDGYLVKPPSMSEIVGILRRERNDTTWF